MLINAQKLDTWSLINCSHGPRKKKTVWSSDFVGNRKNHDNSRSTCNVWPEFAQNGFPLATIYHRVLSRLRACTTVVGQYSLAGSLSTFLKNCFRFAFAIQKSIKYSYITYNDEQRTSFRRRSDAPARVQLISGRSRFRTQKCEKGKKTKQRLTTVEYIYYIGNILRWLPNSCIIE